MGQNNFPSHMHEHLKHYVYLYRDPRNGECFYVGKGQRNRAFTHLNDRKESAKTARIEAIRSAGHDPEIVLLAHGLKDEVTALKVEAAAIDLLDVHNLTNDIRGFESGAYGLMTLNALVSRYEPKKAKIEHPVCLIRVATHFRYSMTAQELYDITRGIWRVNPHKRKPKPEYALAVYDLVVQEVYKIAEWFPAGTTFNAREDLSGRRASDRWEFVGAVAADEIRERYRYKSVADYLRLVSPLLGGARRFDPFRFGRILIESSVWEAVPRRRSAVAHPVA